MPSRLLLFADRKDSTLYSITATAVAVMGSVAFLVVDIRLDPTRVGDRIIWAGAVVAAIGVIWRFVGRPVWRRLKAIHEQVTSHNGGSLRFHIERQDEVLTEQSGQLGQIVDWQKDHTHIHELEEARRGGQQ